MKTSAKEQSVIEFLGQSKISTKMFLCKELSLSQMTIFRALQKHGYYRSFNKNASYYTLQSTPQFNDYGLWFYERVGFSRYGTIVETISALIDKSERGYTEQGLSKLLCTHTANILSRLVKQNRISGYRQARKMVYISADKSLGAEQISQLQISSESALATQRNINFAQGFLPVGIDYRVVILTLVWFIEAPQSSVASVSISLQRAGFEINVSHIREIISFYGLKKK